MCRGRSIPGGSETETVAEIKPADILVADDFIRLSFHQYPPLMDDEGSVDEFEGFSDVVIRNKHPDSSIGKMSHHGADITDCNRVNASEGLVEKHK